MSLGEIKIDFVDEGLVRISGENKQESFDSNGSGKSAIFESLLWALQGETVRGQKKDDIINRYWKGYTEVDIEFEYGNSNYRIVRRRNHPEHGNNITFEIDGEDASGSTMTKTNQIIDNTFDFLSSDLIESIMILGQGLPNKFSGLTPSARKNRLEDISDSAKIIEDLKEKLKSYINKKSEIRDDILSNKASQEALKRSAEQEITTIDNKIKEIEETNNFLSDKEVEKIENNIKSLRKKREGIVEEKQDLTTKKSKLDSTINNFNNNIKNLKKDLNKQNNVLKDLKGDNGEIKCHFCGEILSDKVEKVENLKEDVLVEIKEIKSDLEENTKNVKVLRGKYEKLDNKVTELTEKESKLYKEENKLQEKLDDRPQFDVSIEYLKDERQKYEDQIEEIEKRYKEYDKKLKEEEELISAAKHMKRMVSREFRSYLLRGVVNYINYKLEEYSEILYENKTIGVKLDGNDLLIFFDDRIYESLSGGEKRRIDVAIQFALRDLSMNEAGVGFNILVLDEVFDSVDESGIDKQLKLIARKNEDLESIYQISHRSDLFIPADKEIKIIKGKDGISYLSDVA